MKGSSKVIMGATLVMVVTLAIVLGLVLVLLAELYCSLLRRRRKELQNSRTSSSADGTGADNSSQQPRNQSATSALGSFYAQGVLNAPRNLLFPALSSGKEKVADIEKHPPPPQTSESQTQKPISTSHQFKIVYASSPSLPCISISSSQSVSKVPPQDGGASPSTDGICGDGKENLMYISNPIYDNETSQPSKVETPFGTPDSSPSRLEMSGGSSGEDGDDVISTSLPVTPPLSPMKKLPAEACSVPLRDARSLGISCSDSNSNNGDLSSSSSGSPSTSPSW